MNKMEYNSLYGVISIVVCDVKVEYGHILKTQDYIYVVYGRVLDKLSDHNLSFSELNMIACLIRRGVQEIEEKEH